VFTNMKGDLIANDLRTILQDILYEIIAINIRTNIDQGDARTTRFLFDDFGNIGFKDIRSATFESLFNDFGSELIGAVTCRMIENDIEDTNTIVRMTMFDNVLNNPIPPLTASNGIDILEDLLNTRTLDQHNF
jgi:hypothetical protein